MLAAAGSRPVRGRILKLSRSIKRYGASLLYVDVGLPEKIPVVHLGLGKNQQLIRLRYFKNCPG